MSELIDITRPVWTKSGQSVTGLRTISTRGYALVGTIDGEYRETWTAEGRCLAWTTTGRDLTHTPPAGYVNPDASKPLDFTKPVQTRGGLAMIILSTEGPGDRPIIGHPKDSTIVRSWHRDGSFCRDRREHAFDLIQVPQTVKVVRYINVCPDPRTGGAYLTRESADGFARADRIACIRVEVDAVEGRFDA